MPVTSRAIAIVTMLALAAPTLAMAEPVHGKPGGKGPPAGAGHPGPAGRPAVAPRVVPRGAPGGAGAGVHVGVGHPGPWVFHGHPYAWHPVRFPRPWVYPPGYAYRLWAVGAILPPLFWAANSPYFYTGWASMGLPPPDPGFQYVQYGPDLLLVNIATGEVVQVFPGAFS